MSTLLFLVIMFLTIASAFELPPIVAIGGVIVVVAIIMVFSRRIRLGFPSEEPSEEIPERRPSFPRRPPPPSEQGRTIFPTQPRLGKWVIVPIALALVVAILAFENWWLGVAIFTSLYLRKAATDWWGITYLNNTYFYGLIAVGLLVALSDPRIIVEKGPNGKRRYYLHSKFWGLFNAIRSQIFELRSFSPFPAALAEEPSSDRISLRRGLLWRLVEFAGGLFVIGPTFVKGWALQFLLISNWITSQEISWFELLQRAGAALYARLFAAEIPTGQWLVENSPIFEFLTWLRTPLIILAAIWGVRLFISFVLELRTGNVIKAFRNLVIIAILAMAPILVVTPTQAIDVATPYYLRSMLFGEIILVVLASFLTLRGYRVQAALRGLFRQKIVLTAVVLLVSASLLYGPVVVAIQITPAMEGHWQEYLWRPKYLPNVEYTRWAAGLEPIAEDNINTAMNTGENTMILGSVRAFNREAAVLRMKPSIGVNWMDLTDPDIVNIGGDEYWISALKIVQPPGADPWRSQRLLITHSQRVLAIDASDGTVYVDGAEAVFNHTGLPALYYGEGGLFAESDMVYIGIPGFSETHLPDTTDLVYAGEPDYILTGFERLWYFSGLFGREQLRWDFGRGDYGDVKMLYLRDISERIRPILLPDMILDSDPYLVSDGQNLYYSMYVYIERDMPTEYLDLPSHRLKFWRIFATVLVNTYDGRMTGYLLNTGDSDYVLDFYRSMYPQWNAPVPDWLTSQLRYPEFLLNKQILAYNTYHVSDPDKWQKSTDFFQLTTNSAGRVIEEVRYVTFSLNRRTVWAGVRQVEGFNAPGKNLAGIFVALNGEGFGQIYFLRAGNVAVIGPQTALDTLNNYGPTKFQLTTHTNPPWTAGNILMYVVNGSAYYFIPYYAESATTLSPAMMVVVNALSQKVGYYVISNPQDGAEVAGSIEKAYMDLVGSTVSSPAEVRKANILDEFKALNYTLRTPQELNPNAAFVVGTVDYLTDADLPTVKALIDSFVENYVKPTGLRSVLSWETVDKNRRILNFGVLANEAGVVYLYYIAVAYSSG